jgi:PAS domain-containing protein
MNQNLVREDPADAEATIQSLSEQVAQLEQENTLLEQALQHNFRIFDALLRNGEQGITLTGPDRRIVRVIKGLTGIDPTTLCGVLIDSLAVPEDRQNIVDAYDQLLHSLCGKVTIAVRVPRADGTIVLHRATLTDMLDDPNVQGIVWNYSEHPLDPKQLVPSSAPNPF